MIKANELRIGNWIASSANPSDKETWVIGKVVSICSLQAAFEQVEVEAEEEFTWFFKDRYFGIPLTEEWLIRFNFGRLGKYSFRDKNLIIHHRKRGFVVNKKIAIIQYVHQLQNLYFALTQTELTKTNQ